MAKKNEMEVISITDGQDAFEKTRVESPYFVLLDVTLPGLSGIECARQIRELSTWVKIVLFSSVHSLSLQDSAKKVKADLFVSDSVASVKVPEFVLATLNEKELPPDMSEIVEREVLSRRGAARFPVEGQVQYKFRDQWLSGIFVDVSLDGLLFKTKEPMPEGEKVLISWTEKGIEHVEVPSVVVRTRESDDPEYPDLIGIQYLKDHPAIDQKVTNLSEEVEIFHDDTALELDLDLIQEVLSRGVPYFKELFCGGKAPFFMEQSISDIVEHERNSFQKTDEYSGCIQGLVTCKIICQLISSATENLNTGDFSIHKHVGRLIDMALEILERIELMEQRSDVLVRKSVQDDRTAERHHINETNTRLYQSKTALLKSISQGIKRTSVHKDYVERYDLILEKNRQMVSYQQHLDAVLREEKLELRRSATTKLEKPIEAKLNKSEAKKPLAKAAPKKRVRKTQAKPKKKVVHLRDGKSNSPYPLIAGLIVLALIFPMLGTLFRSQPTASDINFDIRPRSMKRTSADAFVVDFAIEDWDRVGVKGRETILDQIEVYLTRKELHQGKVMDGELLIAAVYKTRPKDKPAFLRTVFVATAISPDSFETE